MRHIYWTRDRINTHLKGDDGMWCIEYRGTPQESEVFKIFRTTLVTTPFTTKIARDKVLDTLEITMNRGF